MYMYSFHTIIIIQLLIIDIDIRIDWRVFNHCPDDNKLIDLITFVGEPFPIITETECANRTDLSSPLVRAIIQPHDGVLSSGNPFIIDQQQMVKIYCMMIQCNLC